MENYFQKIASRSAGPEDRPAAPAQLILPQDPIYPFADLDDPVNSPDEEQEMETDFPIYPGHHARFETSHQSFTPTFKKMPDYPDSGKNNEPDKTGMNYLSSTGKFKEYPFAEKPATDFSVPAMMIPTRVDLGKADPAKNISASEKAEKDTFSQTIIAPPKNSDPQHPPKKIPQSLMVPEHRAKDKTVLKQMIGPEVIRETITPKILQAPSTAPKLIIGRLTVELVQPLKTPEKTNAWAAEKKSNPSKAALKHTIHSKLHFGLGQL